MKRQKFVWNISSAFYFILMKHIYLTICERSQLNHIWQTTLAYHTDNSIWNKLMGFSVLWQQWWHKKIHWQCLCEMAFQYVLIRDRIFNAQCCGADSFFPFYSSLAQKSAMLQMLEIRCWDYKIKKRKIRIWIYFNSMH